MKKIFKKYIIALLLFTLIITSVSNTVTALASNEKFYEMEWDLDIVSAEDWKNTSLGEYPINVQSPEWKNLSYCEALAACNMPEAYAKSLSTSALTTYAVKYPFLLDIFAFETIETGMAHLEQSSTIIKELFSRPDCVDELLKKYIETSCDYELLTNTHDLINTNYGQKIFLEMYFGLNYNNLSEDNVKLFIDEYEKKYNEQPHTIRKYGTSSIFFDSITESMGYVPEEAIPTSIKEALIEESTNELSFTITQIRLVTGSNGAKYYYGYQTIHGVNIYCYQYHSGDYSSDEKQALDQYISTYHPTFTKVTSTTATKKYNCHSYAWYSTSTSNNLWIDDPSGVYNNTDYYSKWIIPMVNPKSGDRILFYSGSSLLHSAILTSTTACKSKLGNYGVYKTTISEMLSFYGASTTQVYVPR